MATLVHAWFFAGTWRAEVSNAAYAGYGTGASMLAAIDAAMQEFKFVQPSGSPS